MGASQTDAAAHKPSREYVGYSLQLHSEKQFQRKHCLKMCLLFRLLGVDASCSYFLALSLGLACRRFCCYLPRLVQICKECYLTQFAQICVRMPHRSLDVACGCLIVAL